MKEQRKFARVALTEQADIADTLGENWSPIKICNISIGGVGLICTQQIHPGTVRMLRFVLPIKHSIEIRAVIRVTHCINHSLFSGFRLGGEFKDLDPETRALIDQYISTICSE